MYFAAKFPSVQLKLDYLVLTHTLFEQFSLPGKPYSSILFYNKLKNSAGLVQVMVSFS